MPSPSPAPAPKSPRFPLNPARWRLALINAGLPAVLLLLAALAGLVWAAWRVLDPTPDKRLVIATGPEDGAYEAFAQRYLPLLQAQGISVTLRPTQGASENLALLRDPASGVQVALVQGGVQAALDADAAEAAVATAAGEVDSTPAAPKRPAGPPPALAALASVAVEPLWLFYREDSAASRGLGMAPDNLAQLAGWRIDIGPEGGGSAPLLRQLAQANALPPEGLITTAAPPVGRVLDLVQGRVDALALVSAPDAPFVRYLLNTPGVRLFNFAQSAAYARRFPFLHALVLPRGVVDLAGEQPPQDVNLVAATATLVAHADLHPALVQLLLQAAQQVHAEPGWFNRRGEFPSASVDEWPLAPEAERFFRSGPPWLQRHLPFWLANFVDRMWIVLLPLLAALLPLSRIVPPLVTLRLRSRIFRWYANLRAVEQALEQPDANLPLLRAELERLDVQTEHIGVPLAFANELYDLRAHIHLVRKRLLARGAGAPGTADSALAQAAAQDADEAPAA